MGLYVFYNHINQMQTSVLSGPHIRGSKAICSTSIPKSLLPLFTIKSPFIPHFSPYEFLTIQYLVSSFLSTPHPMMTTEWFMSIQEIRLSLRLVLLGAFSDSLFLALCLLPSSESASASASVSASSEAASSLIASV